MMMVKNQSNDCEAWALGIDGYRMDESNVYIYFDLDNNAFDQSDLMSPDMLMPPAGSVGKYKFDKKNLSKLKPYDFFPNNANTPVVSDRLKVAINALCPKEVDFLKAVITAKNGDQLDCWSLVPLIRRKCIDTDNSDVARKWAGSELAMEFNRAVLFPNSMQDNHIVRDDDYSTTLFVSDQFKTMLEEINPHGVLFLQPDELRNV